jgi:EmrB/QacA subfamily drug resistance transporter
VTSSGPPGQAKLDPVAVRTTVAIIVGAIAMVLDTTIVSVALRQLAEDLDTDLNTIQWVSTAYLLALGCVIPVVGWLQGRVGAKQLWIGAQAVFLLGSVLCATAWDAPSLIAFRALQGVGGGVMMPLMMTIVMQATPPADRARVMATASLPAALGPILGPVVGGLILAGDNWRWLFLVNVPLCLLGLYLAWKLIPDEAPGRRVKLDLVGLLLVSPGFVALLWGLSNAHGDGGFTRPDVWVPLVLGIALISTFVLRALGRPGAALVDLRVLRSRPTWASALLSFLMGMALYGAMLLLPLYWQETRGEDALHAGLLLIPQGVGSLLSRTATPRLMAAVGVRGAAILGLSLVLLGTIPFALSDGSTSRAVLMAALLVRGIGFGLAFVPISTVAYVGLAHEQVPHASTVTRICQQVGGSVGTALLALVLTSKGFGTAFWWAVGFTGVALVLSVALPGRTAPRRSAPVPVETPA